MTKQWLYNQIGIETVNKSMLKVQFFVDKNNPSHTNCHCKPPLKRCHGCTTMMVAQCAFNAISCDFVESRMPS